jgi:hypothetical protein
MKHIVAACSSGSQSLGKWVTPLINFKVLSPHSNFKQFDIFKKVWYSESASGMNAANVTFRKGSYFWSGLYSYLQSVPWF